MTDDVYMLFIGGCVDGSRIKVPVGERTWAVRAFEPHPEDWPPISVEATTTYKEDFYILRSLHSDGRTIRYMGHEWLTDIQVVEKLLGGYRP